MKRLFSYKNSEEGFAFVFILLAVVLVFSITLVSGSQKFQYSPETLPVPGNPTPTATQSATPNPTQPPNSQNQWNINYTLTSCENGLQKGTIQATGTANGYVTLERQDPSGNYQITSSDQMTAPSTSLGLDLLSSDGYSTSSWRVGLYEGGSGTRNNFSGGTLRTSAQGTPTNCT